MSTDEKLASDDTDELDDELESPDESGALMRAGESSDGEAGAGKRTVGLERWVQLGFMVIAILLVWLYDHIITAVWYIFADPSEPLVSAGAVLGGLATAGVLYANKPAHAQIHGITEELSKVTWPTSKETSSSTLVVVVTSIVAALVLFLFDSVWSAVTDIVYKV